MADEGDESAYGSVEFFNERSRQKGALTRKITATREHVTGRGEPMRLKELRAQVAGLYEECQRLHAAYLRLAEAEEVLTPEAETIATKWTTDLDAQYAASEELVLAYLLEVEPPAQNGNVEKERSAEDGGQQASKLQDQLEESQRGEKEEIEAVRREEERKVNEIQAKRKREQRELSTKLSQMGVRPPLNSTMIDPLATPPPKR